MGWWKPWVKDQLDQHIACHITTKFNTLRSRQNGQHLADDTFKRIFFNENARISINISLKFVPKGRFDNIQALIQAMVWCRLWR